MLETHRRLYNECLAQRKTAYDTSKKSLKYTEQSAWYKNERITNQWYAKLNFSSAQATMRRLDKSFQNFFRRLKTGEKPGYPRFKARGRFESIEFPKHGDGIRLNNNRLRVQHIGNLKVKLHRPVQGTIKTISLKYEGDKWYCIVSCDLGDIQVPKNNKPAIGIDLGLEHFLTTSDEEHEPNPRFLKHELPELHRASRAVSRKKKGGKNRRKAVKKLRKTHARVRNLRRDFHHKTALKLVNRYGFIAVESLTVRGMVKNRRLSRSISDAGWTGFKNILKHKAEKAGVEIVEVDPSWTSQICSGCGQLVQKELSERWHECSCGCSLQRDVNAARNILTRGLVRTEPAGLNVSVSLHVPRSRLL